MSGSQKCREVGLGEQAKPRRELTAPSLASSPLMTSLPERVSSVALAELVMPWPHTVTGLISEPAMGSNPLPGRGPNAAQAGRHDYYSSLG